MTGLKAFSKYLAVVFLAALILIPQAAVADDFDFLVAPSLMDTEMDGWYRIPKNSGPNIQLASKVMQGQAFNLLLLFRGYTPDKDNKVHISYDVQVYDPSGKPTEDNGTDILAYQGAVGSDPKVILLNRQFLKIIFTDKYPLGSYRIKVTAYDRMAGKTVTKEARIELVSFAPGEKFPSEKEVGEWLMGYYANPTPVKAIHGVTQFVQLDREWVRKRLGVFAFYRRVFADNPFLVENIVKNSQLFNVEEKKKLILVSLLSKNPVQAQQLAADNKELKEFLNLAKGFKLPDTDGEINSADQLDCLWSEFLATGRYNPVRKIVSALALSKYKGTIDKLKSGEIKERTKEIEKQAYLDATYQSAVWSLISNCKQSPLVFKYCVYIYKNEPLSEDIKKQLGTILTIVQKQRQDENKTSK